MTMGVLTGSIDARMKQQRDPEPVTDRDQSRHRHHHGNPRPRTAAFGIADEDRRRQHEAPTARMKNELAVDRPPSYPYRRSFK